MNGSVIINVGSDTFYVEQYETVPNVTRYNVVVREYAGKYCFHKHFQNKESLNNYLQSIGLKEIK